MAGFCGSCGAPLNEQSGFCGGCGARVGQQPAAPPVAKSPGGGGSALKVVLIVVGVLFVLGAVSLGGMYYVAHRYVTMAEDLTGVKAGDVVHSIREAASHSSHDARTEKRDGCLLLTRDEASAILGIEVIKVDGKPDERQSGEHCSFFVKPGSVELNSGRVRESIDAIHGESASNSDAVPSSVFDAAKNMARAAVEAERNGEAPYFGFAVERENGKIACSALGIANRLSGVDLVGKPAEPLGVGDQATMGIGESQMCVVKGDVAITLDFTQVTGARSKGIALAKTILPRL
jgi:hypothetical protein